MNNGCICCTVRGDLIRILTSLLERKGGKFDAILIETTGLADPAPVAQTFFVHDEISVRPLCPLPCLALPATSSRQPPWPHSPFHPPLSPKHALSPPP
jgi:hypothetical protein